MSRYRDLENEAEDRIRDNAPEVGVTYRVTLENPWPGEAPYIEYKVLQADEKYVTVSDGTRNPGGFIREFGFSRGAWNSWATRGRIRRQA